MHWVWIFIYKIYLYLKINSRKTKTKCLPKWWEKEDQNAGTNEGETSVSQQKDRISQEGMEQIIDVSNNKKPIKKSKGREFLQGLRVPLKNENFISNFLLIHSVAIRL